MHGWLLRLWCMCVCMHERHVKSESVALEMVSREIWGVILLLCVDPFPGLALPLPAPLNLWFYAPALYYGKGQDGRVKWNHYGHV